MRPLHYPVLGDMGPSGGRSAATTTGSGSITRKASGPSRRFAGLLIPDIGDVRLAVIDGLLAAAALANPNDFDAMVLQYLELAYRLDPGPCDEAEDSKAFVAWGGRLHQPNVEKQAFLAWCGRLR